MARRTQDEFEKIAEDTSRKASAVECSPATYRDGLKTIMHVLATDLAASEETNPEDEDSDDEDDE